MSQSVKPELEIRTALAWQLYTFPEVQIYYVLKRRYCCKKAAVE